MAPFYLGTVISSWLASPLTVQVLVCHILLICMLGNQADAVIRWKLLEYFISI